MTEEERQKGLALLRKPFPEHQIKLLPKPFKKDSPKGNCKECGGYHGLPADHLKYVGHAALTDRLLDADPSFNYEPMTLIDGLPGFDKTGGLWIKLTVCGVTRLGYGHAEESEYKEIGSRVKEVIGDALRNAAMRFGAALDLWHKGGLHITEEPTTQNKSTDSAAPELEKPLFKKRHMADNKFTSGKKVGQFYSEAMKDAGYLDFAKKQAEKPNCFQSYKDFVAFAAEHGL